MIIANVIEISAHGKLSLYWQHPTISSQTTGEISSLWQPSECIVTVGKKMGKESMSSTSVYIILVAHEENYRCLWY